MGFVLIITSLLGVVFGAVARLRFIRSSQGVDHYYWVQVARAFRNSRRLPATLGGKYLLEDDRQYYPPGFGIFLSFFSDSLLRSPRSRIIPVFVDVFTLGLCLSLGFFLGASPLGLLVMTSIFVSAPVLASYNVQLTSRGLGNVFLTVGLASQIAADSQRGFVSFVWWGVSAMAIGLVVITHKMTIQFYLALLPIWIFVVGSQPIGWEVLASTVSGVLIAVLLTGFSFFRMQWLAHLEIVSFWDRNWRMLGAHQMMNSPIYGDPNLMMASRFHQPGFRGVARHLVKVVGYLPSGLILFFVVPADGLTSPFLSWALVAFGLAVTTLTFHRLKCLGGGHLYVFQAVAPVALLWGLTTEGAEARTVFAFSIATLASLMGLWRGLKARRLQFGEKETDGNSLAELLAVLKDYSPTQVAVFPTTLAEFVAVETAHKVLWGGHGLGFQVLEGFWPVVKVPLSELFRDHRVSLAVADSDWWPDAHSVLASETDMLLVARFGPWILFESTTDW